MRRFAATALFAAGLALSACQAHGPHEPILQPGDVAATRDLATASVLAAEAAARTGHPGQAAVIYQRAYARQPSADLAVKWARSLRHAGDAQSAVLLLQEASLQFPSEAILLTELGRCALAGGYMQEAAAALSQAAALPGANWETFMVYGAYAARSGDFAAAEAHFQRALANAPSTRDSMSAMANLALLKADRGDISGAITDLEELARRPGAHPRVHAGLALLYGVSGDQARFRQQAARVLGSAEEVESAARWLGGHG